MPLAVPVGTVILTVDKFLRRIKLILNQTAY